MTDVANAGVRFDEAGLRWVDLGNQIAQVLLQRSTETQRERGHADDRGMTPLSWRRIGDLNPERLPFTRFSSLRTFVHRRSSCGVGCHADFGERLRTRANRDKSRTSGSCGSIVGSGP
jgi:hypothetical protein